MRWAASGSCSQALALARAAAWTTASGRASSKAASRRAGSSRAMVTGFWPVSGPPEGKGARWIAGRDREIGREQLGQAAPQLPGRPGHQDAGQ